MGSADGGVIKFPDGSQVSFDWAYRDAPEYEWVLEREHWPDALTPMDAWIWNHAGPGIDRAWTEIDLEPPPMFQRFQVAGPHLYVRVTPLPPERMAALAPRYIAVGQEYGGALGLWNKWCEPRIKQATAELAAMDASADLRVAAETLFYGFHQTFTCLGLLFIPNMQLSAMLTQYNVEDAELTGFELIQGGTNATQDIDEEIWKLAEIARATPAVAKIIESKGDAALDALRHDPEAAKFVAAFDDLIARHSSRSQGWMLTLPTWGERPEAALSLVRAQIGADRVSPDDWRKRTAERRQAATDRVLAALPAEKHDEFRGVIKQLDGYVYVREGRAYRQLTISGTMRGVLLRVGAALVEKGRIGRADDIFFITPEDVPGDAELRDKVNAARAEWEHWTKVEPPLFIGTPGEESAKAEAKRSEFTGSPASRGTVTAPVRILRSPEEGSKLQRGDILVTAMTTPAWTPLFAIAGGIITETGGALSHPAITAREYGIPAVVALDGATTRFKDGQVVTMDGGAGTVVPA